MRNLVIKSSHFILTSYKMTLKFRFEIFELKHELSSLAFSFKSVKAKRLIS